MIFRGSLGLVLVFAVTAASSGTAQSRARSATAAAERTTGTSNRRPATASSASVRGLSLHDRIAQLFIVRGYGDYPSRNDPEYQRFLRWIREDHVGGFIVAGRIRNGSVISAQPFEMATFINRMQRIAKTPLLVGSDFERGASARVAETARFPYMMAFGAANDLNATKELGQATAREARALGVNWVFAPDADVNNNPDNPIINVRSFGASPQAVAAQVSAFIDGAHADPSRYVLVTPKHFPGHGDTSEDSHMQLAKLAETRERIESLELVPFRAAIQHGADAVMTAHLSVPAFDQISTPATLSPNILTGLLRNELGFTGLVVTDALEMQAIAASFPQGEAAVRAIEAGADVLLMPTDPAACIRAIMAAVASGRISRTRIDVSAAKVLAAKRRVGLYRTRLVNLDEISDQLEERKADALAQRVANGAVTLVKDTRHLFPAPAMTGSCLVVLGESTFTQRGETLATELQRGGMRDLKIYVLTPAVPDSVLQAVVQDASHCGQIYVAAFITVAANRGNVTLEDGLGPFLKGLIAGPSPVALISLGNPYLLRDYPAVSAYAATFSTTGTSEMAAARAILGDIPITGTLPVSIPGIANIGEGLRVAVRPRSTSN
ncbi:MAG: glycoside hydrolase family 3 protein [Bryobacteraceae bacterium]